MISPCRLLRCGAQPEAKLSPRRGSLWYRRIQVPRVGIRTKPKRRLHQAPVVRAILWSSHLIMLASRQVCTCMPSQMSRAVDAPGAPGDERVLHVQRSSAARTVDAGPGAVLAAATPIPTGTVLLPAALLPDRRETGVAVPGATAALGHSRIIRRGEMEVMADPVSAQPVSTLAP
jgi:hypothetical protein